MSRLPAWIASRRQQRSASRASAPGVRLLRLERYAQRIALTTNGAWMEIGDRVMPSDGGAVEISPTMFAASNANLTTNVFLNRAAINDSLLGPLSSSTNFYYKSDADVDVSGIGFNGADFS